jgi:hypothetical protein
MVDRRKETEGRRWEKGNGRQDMGGRGRGRWDNEEVDGEELIKGEGTRYRFGKGEMVVKTRNRRHEI